MANFIPPGQRARHTFIESTIENYLDVLQKNNNEAGHIHTDTSEKNQAFVENLTVPNLRNGQLHLGKIALRNEEFIPIWSSVIGEKIYIPSSFTLSPPSQATQIRAILTQKEVPNEDINTLLEYSPQHFYPQSIGRYSNALVADNSTFGAAEDGSSLYVHGRPFVLLNMQAIEDETDKKINYTRTSPDILHHELVHVDQSLNKPVHTLWTMGDFEDYFIASEIEAYLHHAVIVDELKRQQYHASDKEYLLDSTDTERFKDIRHITNKYDKLTAPNYTVKPDSRSVRAIRKLGMTAQVLSFQISRNQRKRPFSTYEA